MAKKKTQNPLNGFFVLWNNKIHNEISTSCTPVGFNQDLLVYACNRIILMYVFNFNFILPKRTRHNAGKILFDSLS